MLAYDSQRLEQSVVRLVNRQFPETRGKAVEIRVDLNEMDRVAITQEAWCTFAESRDADGVERYTVEIIPGDVEESGLQSRGPGSSAWLLQDMDATPKRLAKQPVQKPVPRLQLSMVKRRKDSAVYDEEIFLVKVVGSTKIGAIMDAVVAKLDGDDLDFKAVYEGMRLSRNETVAGRDMEDGDEIRLLREQLGGKPVIYLLLIPLLQPGCTFAESRDADGVERYTVEIIPGDLEESQAPGSSARLLQDMDASPRTVTLDLVSSRSRGPIPYLKALYDGQTFLVKVVGSTKIGAIVDLVLAELNFVDGELPLNVDFKAVYENMRLIRADTVARRDMEDGDEIMLMREQLGGKPVTELEAIEVSIVPDWSFSALYPVVPTTTSKSAHLHQSARWDVKTGLAGTMLDKTNGVQQHELCSGQLSPPQSPILGPSGAFRPALAKDAFRYAASVALDVPDVPLYLDAALLNVIGHHILAALVFAPQTRPPFVYPPILVRSRRAVEYLAQSRCHEGQRGLWAGTDQREVGMWRDVVGVPAKTRQADTTLFRVLEWGGMETCL
uniref:Ubiquitin-like domain-containing protein n=1 Tax=Mycena chlorophos TaxID=658473 RepID=A0ABQ0L629_MYCCL|nr:predicted protein [Mycena chlorophos]